VSSGQQQQWRFDLSMKLMGDPVFVPALCSSPHRPWSRDRIVAAPDLSFSISVNQFTKGTMGTPAAQRQELW